MPHSKFPGVAASVELLRRRTVKGIRVEEICGDLEKLAASHSEELIAAARAEPDDRVRRILLGIICEAKLPDAVPLFVEVLMSGDDDSRFWAERGQQELNTSEARAAAREFGLR